MQSVWLVFLGGGLGSVCRYGMSALLFRYHLTFPLATFLSNALACLLIGIFTGLAARQHLDAPWRMLLMTGFCGGFSTFSTFSAETLQLLQTGQTAQALLNMAGSLAVCLLFVWLGLRLAS